MNKKDIKKQNIIQLVLSIVIIALLNTIGTYVFTRFDLTQEKRYTLSDATVKLLEETNDFIFFKVYLEGDFPAGFKRLRNSTREMLDEFRAHSKYIEYEFINPVKEDDQATTRNLYRQLVEKGLEPSNLSVEEESGFSQKVIFPGAIVSYHEKEIPLQLLSSSNGNEEEALNNSIQDLEFKLAKTIKKLITRNKPTIGFVFGHGELDKAHTGDIAYSLADEYSLSRININGNINSLTKRMEVDSNQTLITKRFDALVIAKPDSAFSEKDKFILDQYIMMGGKILWLVDPVFASMDSLQKTNETIGLPILNRLKIEDQLFHYGARLNRELLLDLNALPIPLKTGQIGNKPQFSFFPWYFFPLITPTSTHPIVKNLDVIKSEFISPIDTIAVPGITKTILLTTSDYTRVYPTPARISLDMLRENQDKRLYNKKNIAVAVLLEGKFESLYKNRIPPSIKNNKDIGFLENSKETAMIIVSDGDIIKNQIQEREGRSFPLPLGYDKFTRQTFGNKDFILNAINYLCDGNSLIEIRSREIKIRLLDKTKYQNNRIFWQILNILGPIALVIIFSIVKIILRKRKYSSN